jgi:CRISPR-associated protein Csx14
VTVAVERAAVIAKANPPWNFWSGQQTSARIWRLLRQKLRRQLSQLQDNQLSDLFNVTVPLSGRRFGFDPGPAWNALDVGFSPNEHHGFGVVTSAAVELLAVVGIQRFRPVVSANGELIDYTLWSFPLSPLAAAAIVGGLNLATASRTWRCRVVSRGSYAALSRSFPLPGDPDVAQRTVGRLDS